MKRPAKNDERGMTAVIVVLSLTAIFGAAVLSIDAGHVWRNRRDLITDTDAAALAAARQIDAAGKKACHGPTRTSAETEARSVVAANDSRSLMTGFTVRPTSGNCDAESGTVRVDATLETKTSFAGVFGIGKVNVASSSVAQWGPLSQAIGIRPLGVCDKSESFLAWTRYLNEQEPNWGSLPFQRLGPNGEVINRVEFQRGSSGCGSGSGNWDWLDFNGDSQPNGTDALREWLLNGYDGRIALGDAETGQAADCNAAEPGSQPFCDPKTGSTGGAAVRALETVRDERIVFPILIYDRVVDARDPRECNSPNWTGSGDNARFCHVAFLLVRVHGWTRITGNDGSFDLEFLDQWWQGTIGRNPSGGRPTTHGISLCGGGYGATIDQSCDV